MKRIEFIESPNKLTLNELKFITGGVKSCTEYSGTCTFFDDCKDKFTGHCGHYCITPLEPKK